MVSIKVLEAGLDLVRRSPADLGHVALIVRRPAPGKREVVSEASLDQMEGLLGDTWLVRGSRHTADGAADRDAQLTLMNVRAARLIAGDVDRMVLAGDQIFVDFDISAGNIPPGTRLRIGSAIVEVSPKPHTGCRKFTERFGVDAIRLVSSPAGQELNVRGIKARIVIGGAVAVGSEIRPVEGRPQNEAASLGESS
jgi:hypothetical protein